MLLLPIANCPNYVVYSTNVILLYVTTVTRDLHA